MPDKPQLLVDHDSAFGYPVYIGSAPQDSISIKNGGLHDLIISSVRLDGDSVFSSDGPTSTQLKGNQSAFVRFIFSPTQEKSYSGTFTIVSNAENAPSKVINLSGTGVRLRADGGP